MTSNDRCSPQYALSDLIFSAKIDFLTVHTPGKRPLPRLEGTPRWVRRENYRKLAVHDATRGDVALLIAELGDPRLAELEIAVDIAPPRGLPDEQREQIVDYIMVHQIARGLAPKVRNQDLAPRFRGAFEGVKANFRLVPFNRVLPAPHAQQLHGKGNDPLQVKAYGKKTDQGHALAKSEFVARHEVRMGGYGLSEHDIFVLSDLLAFRYRKRLMPYFRHVKGTKRRRGRAVETNAFLRLLMDKHDELMRPEWDRVGVGAFIAGGKYQDRNVRLVSDSDLNNRIGQALLRLERRMKFVRGGPSA